jgi:hypothetical protein
METTEIGSRSEFALWAIARAQEILTQEGTAFAMAARDGNDEALAASAAGLWQDDCRRHAGSVRRPDRRRLTAGCDTPIVSAPEVCHDALIRNC